VGRSRIRGHCGCATVGSPDHVGAPSRGIENRLHWVKDVVFKEDASRVYQGNTPANFSIVRAIAINIFRQNGYDSVTTHQRSGSSSPLVKGG
jgi:hypothetical protein